MKKTIFGALFALFMAVGILTAWKYFLVNQTKQEIDRAIDDISAVESLEYENLRVGLRANWYLLSNASIKIDGLQDKIVAREILLSHHNIENNHLISLKGTLKDVGISSKAFFLKTPSGLTAANKPKLIISNISWYYRYDPQQKIMTIKDVKITADHSWKIDAFIELTNIDPSRIPIHNLSSLLPYVLGVSVSQMSFSYQDRSFFQKRLSAQHTWSDSSLLTFLEVAHQNVFQMIQEEKDKNTRIVLEKILKFTDNPQQIHITMSPSKPVPFGRFLWVKQLREVIRLLNIQVEL